MPTLHNPIALSLGPIDVRWYALFILSGIICGIALVCWLAGKRGMDPGVMIDMAPWVVIIGIAAARLYFVALEWKQFKDDIPDAFNVRGGGLSIHGAIVAGAFTIWVITRRWNLDTWTVFDVIVPGVALGQAFGRWGNWANQEAFGKPTDVPWAVTIDPGKRPAGYEAFSTFHPTFLYESIANALICAVLVWFVLKGPAKSWFRNGQAAGFYLIAYGIARFIIESMRTDSLYIGPWPAAYWLSFALIGIGAIIVTWRSMVPLEQT